jgi:hypothetical protein
VGRQRRSGKSGATWHNLAGEQQTRRRARLHDLARLRRVRDRIDREYAQPLDVEALARGSSGVVQIPGRRSGKSRRR